jgi:hypothetical protein
MNQTSEVIRRAATTFRSTPARNAPSIVLLREGNSRIFLLAYTTSRLGAGVVPVALSFALLKDGGVDRIPICVERSTATTKPTGASAYDPSQSYAATRDNESCFPTKLRSVQDVGYLFVVAAIRAVLGSTVILATSSVRRIYANVRADGDRSVTPILHGARVDVTAVDVGAPRGDVSRFGGRR